MVRLILGVILGLLIGVFVTGAVEGIGHMVAPPPPGVNLTDPAQMASVMEKIPTQAKIAVVLAWFLGVLSGASVANMVAGRRRLAGLITGGLLVALGVFTMATIPHPLWMMVTAALGYALAIYTADRAFGRPKAL